MVYINLLIINTTNHKKTKNTTRNNIEYINKNKDIRNLNKEANVLLLLWTLKVENKTINVLCDA